jgi:class 3 adenylate cyclase/pimeloyl-ACP methyl ester carboxylesterase
MRSPPEPRFAKSGDVHIAYCVVGEGPVDMVYVPGWVSNIELMWSNDRLVAYLEALASFSRLIVFDKRGTGLSDRVPDQALPDLETRMDDVRAVMDAANSNRAFLLGQSEGGPMSALFAATYPERTRGVVFYGSDVRGAWAPDHAWGMTEEDFRRDQEAVARGWGNGAYARTMVAELMASEAADPEFVAWWVSYFRQSASPGAAMALNRMWFETDARDIIRRLALPTLVVWRADDPVAGDSRWLAANVMGASVAELPGGDHVPWIGDTAAVVEAIRGFVSSVRDEEATLDRTVVTVLVTDIVGSTQTASEIGDREWRGQLERHHAAVRAQLARYRGREVDTAGDGFLATFDGPTRAVRCAQAIRDTAATLGLEVRAGVHTGEVGTVDGKVAGIAINIAARISAAAAPSEVLVSQTVKDLTAGSGIELGDAGEHALKGVSDTWRCYRVMR